MIYFKKNILFLKFFKMVINNNKIFLLIFYLLILGSCSYKNNLDIEEIKKNCELSNMNGIYEIELIRFCDGDSESTEWGNVKMNLDNCVLSVDDLYGANLYAEPDNLDAWKSLKGKIDKKGRINGSIYLRYLMNPKREYANLNFYGNINEYYMKARHSACDFNFNLKKIKNEEDDLVDVDNNQSESSKESTIIIPTGILGDISENQRIILEKTLESRIDNYFAIVPKDLFEEAQEKAFEELDYEECTEDQCIIKIQELLQVENAFKLLLVRDGNDTQISLTWNNLDEKRVEEFYCENCSTKRLRESIEGIVEKLISNNR